MCIPVYTDYRYTCFISHFLIGNATNTRRKSYFFQTALNLEKKRSAWEQHVFVINARVVVVGVVVVLLLLLLFFSIRLTTQARKKKCLVNNFADCLDVRVRKIKDLVQFMMAFPYSNICHRIRYNLPWWLRLFIG